MRLLILLPLLLTAHEPITTKLTWTQEISRIVYKRCASCHGEKSNIPLVSYDDARPWAKAIREEVLERRMPPWGAVKGFGEFRDDPSLSQSEIDRIVNWVEGGAPKGDDIYLPSLPAPPKAKPARLTRGMTVRRKFTVGQGVTATGIRPTEIPEGGWVQVTAALPDGAVHNLIWLKDWRKAWMRTYFFREPVWLPKGTTVNVYSDGPVAVLLGFAAR